MRSLIFGLLARIARGERYEKPAPFEMRCQFAVFAGFPIFIGSFLYVGLPLLHGAGALMLSLYLLASLLVTIAIVFAWAIWIPLRASLVCSIFLWILVLWGVWHFDLDRFISDVSKFRQEAAT